MKTYRGLRLANGTEVLVIDPDRDDLRVPLTHHVYHSPDGYEWGYSGSGPTELAKDILWDYFGHEADPSIKLSFREHFIANIRTDAWFITEEDIGNWLASLPVH